MCTRRTFRGRIRTKNVTVIDWYGLVSKHPEWLSGDGVHPNDAGTEQYAKLVHDALAEALAK